MYRLGHVAIGCTLVLAALTVGCSEAPVSQEAANQQTTQQDGDNRDPASTQSQPALANSSERSSDSSDALREEPTDDKAYSVAHALKLVDLTKLPFPNTASRPERTRKTMSFAAKWSDQEAEAYLRQALEMLGCAAVTPQRQERLYTRFEHDGVSLRVDVRSSPTNAQLTHIQYDLDEVANAGMQDPPTLDNAQDTFRRGKELTYSISLPWDQAVNDLTSKLDLAGWKRDPKWDDNIIDVTFRCKKQDVHVIFGAQVQDVTTYVSVGVQGTVDPGDLPMPKSDDSPAHFTDQGNHLFRANLDEAADFINREMDRLGWTHFKPIEETYPDDTVVRRFFRGGTLATAYLEDLGGGHTEVIYAAGLFPLDVPVPPDCTKTAMTPYRGHFYFETTAAQQEMISLYKDALTEFGLELDQQRSNIDGEKPRLIFRSTEPRETWWLEVWNKGGKTFIELRRMNR